MQSHRRYAGTLDEQHSRLNPDELRNSNRLYVRTANNALTYDVVIWDCKGVDEISMVFKTTSSVRTGTVVEPGELSER